MAYISWSPNQSILTLGRPWTRPEGSTPKTPTRLTRPPGAPGGLQRGALRPELPRRIGPAVGVFGWRAAGRHREENDVGVGATLVTSVSGSTELDLTPVTGCLCPAWHRSQHASSLFEVPSHHSKLEFMGMCRANFALGAAALLWALAS